MDGSSFFSICVAKVPSPVSFRACMSCPQLASGCRWSHKLKSDEQQLITLPWALTAIVLNSASLSGINSLPKSFHACGFLSQAAHNWSLTCLTKYFKWGRSSTTDRNINIECIGYYCYRLAQPEFVRIQGISWFGGHWPNYYDHHTLSCSIRIVFSIRTFSISSRYN